MAKKTKNPKKLRRQLRKQAREQGLVAVPSSDQGKALAVWMATNERCGQSHLNESYVRVMKEKGMIADGKVKRK